MAQVIEIPLRREDNTQPWGFRLKGGVDQGGPLHVESAALTGRAARSGFKAGDYLLAINGVSVTNMSHEEVKSEMLRGGNALDIIIQRGQAPQPGDEFTPAPPPGAAQAPAPSSVFAATRGGQVGPNEPRSQVSTESSIKIGGPTYKQVQPKTYQILDDELPASEAGMGDRPSSIFDRKKQERSDYLKAKGPTIQKAYGQS